MAPSAHSRRPKHAAALLGVSLPTLWRWARERPDFPQPRRLSSRCTVFDESELVAWRDAQVGTQAADVTPAVAAARAKRAGLHAVAAAE